MDSAACIGCGACVAACKNASAALFTSAKISHLGAAAAGAGRAARARRARWSSGMDAEGFGSCSNEGECEAVCPKEIPITNIARMNRDYLKAMLSASEVRSSRAERSEPRTLSLDRPQTLMTSTSSLTAAADFLQRGVLFRRQLDLDDLLDAARAELDRHADEQIADAVLALQEHRARQDLLLVLQDGLDHLRRRRARRVPGARADQLGDLGAAVGGPLADRRRSAPVDSSSVIGMPATVE